MPKLLQINVTANWGSHGKIAEDIGLLALQKGWDSFIAYGRNANPSMSQTIQIGNKFSIRMHAIQSMLFDRHGLASASATRQFVAQIESIKPDIIHLHNIHGYYLNYPILFEFLANYNRPVVWTLHDCWPFTGHCAYFTYDKCEKWKTGCFDCKNKTEYPRRYLNDRSEHNYALKKKYFQSVKNLTLVPVSNWLGSIVDESYLKEVHRVTIHNGINLDLFKFTESRMPHFDGKRMVLGVCSFWDRRKGLSDIIELGNYLDDSYVIVLVGLSPKQISGLPSNIVGIERTNNIQELVSYYSRADVFINTTYEDNFPTTNLEALACGTPVITYNTGGSPEAIDKNTGLVVDCGNAHDLERAVRQIVDNGKAKYADLCRKRAEMLFDRNICYERYIELYENLLS